MKIYERRNGGKTDWLLIVVMTSLTFGCASGPSHEEGYKYVNGVNHYYEIYGSGDPVFVLHGGPGMYHDELVPHFAPLAKTNAVIFYDQRWNGRSLLERIDRDTFNVELMVEDLELLRQAFKIERLTLLGHSWGGLLALYYATKYPDNVERLIIIDAAPVNTELLIKSYENLVSRFTESEWAHLQEMYDSEEYQKGNPAVHNEAMRLSEGKTFYRKELIDEYMLHASFDERTAKNMVEIAPLATEMKLSISVQDDLGRISCPVLIIHSRQDFVVEESPRLVHELLANSRIEYIENSGHYPFIEAPEALFEAIHRFLKEK